MAAGHHDLLAFVLRWNARRAPIDPCRVAAASVFLAGCAAGGVFTGGAVAAEMFVLGCAAGIAFVGGAAAGESFVSGCGAAGEVHAQ